MRTPLVAIIGLPNSGKSTLFNKILERRSALTYPEEGTTRDRAYGLTEWNGLSFVLIDTAGIVPRPDSELEKSVQKQTAIAREEADLILLVADGRTPISQTDLQIAKDLGPTKKPVVLAVNKIDSRSSKTEAQAAAFKKLGLGTPYPVSAINSNGLGDLLDAVVEKLKESFPPQRMESYDNRTKIAFVGKPNVGKSSLINSLLNQERVLVHDMAGTTRSTVEIPFESNGHEFLLLDTAGIKKKWKQDSDVEAAAAMQSIRTINQADVIFFTIDASLPITAQDQIVARQILEARKACVIVLNKIDLMDKDQQSRILDILPDYFPQMWFLPVLFTSANSRQGVDLLLKFAVDAKQSANRKIDAEELEQFLLKIREENMPGKMDDQRAPKLYKLTQQSFTPPTFIMQVNFPAAIATSWKKWFEKQFRLKFGFEGTPIEIKYIRKHR